MTSGLTEPFARPHWGLPRDPAPATRAATGSCGERAAAVEITSQHHSSVWTKPTDSKEGAETEAQEPRKLNMEEKRKLEKLLIADIDSAVARYDAITGEEATGAHRKASATPAAEAKSAVRRVTSSRCKQREELEAKLR